MENTKKPAKILAADIKFISLCFEGKNLIRGIYKSKGEDQKVSVLRSSRDLGEGRLLTVLYPPNKFDEDLEWADESGIQTMINSFAKNGGKIDVDHDGNAIDAHLVESFTIQATDTRFDEFTDDEGNELSAESLAGGWAGIIQIDDDEYKDRYANGDWAGASIAGEAVLTEDIVLEKAKVSGLKKLMSRLLKPFTKDQETNGLRGLNMTIDLANPGDVDYLGNPKKDSFYISLNGELLDA